MKPGSSKLTLDLSNPYGGHPESKWPEITNALVDLHPLKRDELAKVVLETWEGIFESRIGARGYQLGIDIRPNPQSMAHYIHELVPLELQQLYPGTWRREATKTEKDVVYIPDLRFSFEVKSSSSPAGIFGNRSYAQPTPPGQVGRKGKSGYYLAINFAKFTEDEARPRVGRIRFGWLDHTDWIPQKKETGQAAHLAKTARVKLLTIFELSSQSRRSR